MDIHVTHLTLRFYVRAGWTEKKVREYLIDKTRKIELRLGLPFSSCDYYAVYENSGFGIFKKALLNNHFINPNNYDIKYYVKN
jgi:hypothetical protein